jgi:hypothetical protein
MAREETRRLLKVFGVAVTTLEDALEARRPGEELRRLEQELAERLREITALVERLQNRRPG